MDSTVAIGGEKSDKGAKSRFEKLAQDREPFLQRARLAAKVTIPTLIPPLGMNQGTTLATPYQSIGARGLNNLASKLLLALFPPNSPFFRLMVDEYTVDPATADPQLVQSLDKALAKIERAVMTEIETTNIRVSGFEAFKHLICGGNVMPYLPDSGGMKVFHLERYVVNRDAMGLPLEIIVKETMDRRALPKEAQDAINEPSIVSANGVEKQEQEVDVYTWVRLSDDGKRYLQHQEVSGIVLPNSEGSYPKDDTPWLPLRWHKIDGEDYGRGFVEEYQGDLQSAEGLSRALVEGAAGAAKMVWMVKPNGTTKKKVISDSANGAVVEGNPDDVKCLQMEKYADFKFAQETLEVITDRLSMAFMLNSAVQRNGERVTAEEIRYMAGELEDALGGVYSILSQEFQYPLVQRIMNQMGKQKKLPKLPKDKIRPAIVTGLEALGRGHDLNKLNLLLSNLQPLGPEVIAQYLDVSNYITRVAVSIGIDAQGLIRSPDEVQQQQQAAQQQSMIQGLGPHVINAVPKIQKNLQDQQAAQAAPPAPVSK